MLARQPALGLMRLMLAAGSIFGGAFNVIPDKAQELDVPVAIHPMSEHPGRKKTPPRRRQKRGKSRHPAALDGRNWH